MQAADEGLRRRRSDGVGSVPPPRREVPPCPTPEHVPGLQPADVEELLEHGARVVVLSRGMNRRLRVQDETLRRLEEEGVEAHVTQTEEAVRLYNDLREREKPVGGLFHSTC